MIVQKITEIGEQNAFPASAWSFARNCQNSITVFFYYCISTFYFFQSFTEHVAQCVLNTILPGTGKIVLFSFFQCPQHPSYSLKSFLLFQRDTQKCVSSWLFEGRFSAREGGLSGYSNYVICIQSWCVKTRGHTPLVKHIKVKQLAILGLQGNRSGADP